MKCKIILFLLNLIGGRKNQENEEEKGRALGVRLFRKEMLMKRKWLIPIACFTLCLMMAGGAFAAKQVEKKANEPEAVAKPYLSGEAIAGAKLQIIDKDGKVIKEWISTEDTFEINAELTTEVESLQARLGEAENSVERWKDMYLTKHEPKRGEWIYEDLDNFRKYKVTCPHCGTWFVGNYDAYDEPSEFLYCPHCGNICNPANLDWENELKEREKEARAKMEVQDATN